MNVQATPPSITPAQVEASIASEFYFTAGEAVIALDRGFAPEPLLLLTICVLVMTNGFTALGTSACAHPDKFDADIGKRLARDDAVRKVWPLLGFALRDRIHHEGGMSRAVASLMVSAEVCEGNAPIHEAEGRAEQAELSRTNAAAYRAAIARLQA